ncbi:3-carboxyethylcatechol 2,3-dioxygenase [Nocardia sp. CDC186]|uniref:2,3-dihydroxyphenylpropionate/2,3-dihydroxicinnamic acid 1,2-dioxygenase n=1 Tax=Nocardia implantans TaxID=3108168 RepID=A0ABU6ARR4_9NOCA|nr:MULTISPECIES: 3-carboxyethylcatechol 2,3-dioxygenase [unclassified Nocardia]MBF6191584.1 3-carboxyethylcatechol 2,3-dioxygenase [Nocardia beijingensis]MEA3528109.1 3-carboxyethylcatechol 2,3-dioxygenase [Nocardia sp. CDC192]MEB3510139.1 3-carboxyethylcatechol 2,3-dioxygenase [Nocardia sp. CDC186]
MPLAVCCVSHSPLLDLPGPDPELLADIESALDEAARFVRAFDPEVVVVFAPDHYNGFFYKLMPPFCIAAAAAGVGDYGTHAGPLDVPTVLATELAEAVLAAGVDVAVSLAMDVDHGTVQPLQRLLGSATARPVVPIFVNSVAVPLGPLRRARALGAAVGGHLSTLGKRVLMIGSGGLSHDPPVPALATATGPVRERIVHGGRMTAEQRNARQQRVIEAAREFAAGRGGLQPLNPEWDRRFLRMLDDGRLEEFDDWTNARITAAAGNSAHEVRTWVAAFAALAGQGPYRTTVRYYRSAPALIAGFAVRAAVADQDNDSTARRRA